MTWWKRQKNTFIKYINNLQILNQGTDNGRKKTVIEIFNYCFFSTIN